MRVVIYRPTKSEHDAALADALLTGFEANGDKVFLKKSVEFSGIDEWTQMIVLIGLSDKSLYTQHIRAGKSVLLIDDGYINPQKYYRFALDGFQSWFLHSEPMSHDRLATILKEAGLTMLPFTERQQPLGLYVGNPEAYCRWHELTDDKDDKHSFDSNMCRHIAVRIIPQVWGTPTAAYLPNASFNADHPKFRDGPRGTIVLPPDTPLSEALKDCSMLVEHGGNFGVAALIAGVPVVVTTAEGISPVYPIAGHGIEAVRAPPKTTDAERVQVLANLAWHQFTLNEIASGMALQHLTPHTIKHLEGMVTDPNNQSYLIAQYRMMHNAGKYRGGLNEEIIAHITTMVDAHKPQSLLDYGSGKGRQYLEKKQHELWNGPEPTCYDPAHAPFATRPEGQFDGVICTDVAEHIPPEGVEAFLDDVLQYARKFVFFCIYTGPAIKYLPDGRNVHLTVRKQKWWNQQIFEAIYRREPANLTPIDVTVLSDKSIRMKSSTIEITTLYRGGERNEKAA